YRIIKSIRDMCVFARQNLVADPPFSHLDLVTCRNLLIYLAPHVQKRVIPTIHYALNPTGFLMLGSSETIGTFTDLFGLIDLQHRIYVKKAMATRQYPHFQIDQHRPAQDSRHRLPSPMTIDWQREADRLV